MYDNEKVVGIVILATIVILCMLVIGAEYMTIPYQDYEQIKKWQHECPELSPLIDECAENEYITKNEYLKIERRYHILKLKSP